MAVPHPSARRSGAAAACALALVAAACSGDESSNDSARPQDLVYLGGQLYVDPCQVLPPADAIRVFALRDLVVRHDYHDGVLAAGENPRPGLCRIDPVDHPDYVMINVTAAPGTSHRKHLEAVPGLSRGIREAGGYFVKEYADHAVTLEIVGSVDSPREWAGVVNEAFAVIDEKMKDPEQLQPAPTTAAVDGSETTGPTPWLQPCELLTSGRAQKLLDVPLVPVAYESPARLVAGEIDQENSCSRRARLPDDSEEREVGVNPPSYRVELRIEYGAGFADDHWQRIGGPYMEAVGGVDALFASYEVSAEDFGGQIDLAFAIDSHAFLLTVRGEDPGDEAGLPEPVELVPLANEILADVATRTGE